MRPLHLLESPTRQYRCSLLASVSKVSHWSDLVLRQKPIEGWSPPAPLRTLNVPITARCASFAARAARISAVCCAAARPPPPSGHWPEGRVSVNTDPDRRSVRGAATWWCRQPLAQAAARAGSRSCRHAAQAQTRDGGWWLEHKPEMVAEGVGPTFGGWLGCMAGAL